MKFRITKDEYAALPDAMKALYIADGDGFRVAIEGYEDPAELRRAKDREVQEKRELKDKVAQLEAKLNDASTGSARAAGDIATLEKAWEAKLAAKETELNGRIEKLKSAHEAKILQDAVSEVSNAITGKPENAALIALHVQQRLCVTYDGDVPTVRVKDAKGQISANSLADLQKEMVADPKFGSVVVISKASGSGGSGHNTPAGGGAGASVSGSKKFSEMTGAERTALFQANRAEFDRLANEQKAAENERRFGPVVSFDTSRMTPINKR